MKAQRAEPVIHNTLGSTLHLPFLASSSNVSSATAGNGGSGHPRQATGGGGLRRPQSVMSLGVSSRAAPTVTHIARALTSSTSVNRPKTLPCETQVLAALLVPFLGPHSNEQVSVEQQTAVETFEYAIRTWKAASHEAELDRCIWCCKAASVYSRSRMRILGSLSNILFSRDRTFQVETPAILQTLLQCLFSLLVVLRSSQDSRQEADAVAAYIVGIKSGQSGTPSPQALEKEYGVRHKGDSDEHVREIIAAESVIGCLEVGSEVLRRWTLHNLVEEHWTSSDSQMLLSPLLTTMTWRKLRTFVNSSVSLLLNGSLDPRQNTYDADVVIHLLRTRILPEVEAMQDDAFAVVGEIQSSIIRLVLELLCIRGTSEREWVMLYFSHWVQEGGKWRESVERSLQNLIGQGEWPTILRLMPILEELPEDIRVSLIPDLLPAISDRLTRDPPERSCAPLSDFLDSAAISCPKAFFKPVFGCAASMKDLTIANHLCSLYSVARFYPGIWTHNPEMMSVAIMMDPTGSRKVTEPTGAAPTQGRVRIGQMVIMVELLHHLRRMRQLKDPAAFTVTHKFVVSLEARLGMLIEAKEQNTLIPASQRLLFCALFRECRLFTRSLRSAAWLPSVANWTSSYLFDANTDPDHELNEDEAVSTLSKLIALYSQAKAGLGGGGKRRTTVVGPTGVDTQQGKTAFQSGSIDAYQDSFDSRITMLQSLIDRRVSTALDLLVTVSGLLQPDDYMRLGPILWYKHLDNPEPHVIAPTCFLVMQCAEKIPTEFSVLINQDLSSAEVSMRRHAVQRMATMASWRFQLLSQEVILDKNYRRPFKLTRPPVLFVPTDIGSNLFELEEDPNDFKDSKGHVLPLELRRRLNEVGWAEERGEMDPKTEWIKTPMTRLPTQQLDSLSSSPDAAATTFQSQSPSPSPEPSPTRASPRESPLSRKDSSVGQSRAKRRPVFVATLVGFFPKLAAMVKDSDFVVANTARNLVLDLMRDDPQLLCRSVFHELSGDATGIMSAITTLRNFLHCEFALPPGAAHHMLNHVVGFLKGLMRHTESVDPLLGFGYSSPIVAKLAPQVSKMSMRDIRRAKVDTLLLPSGSLWWNDAPQPGPMFPRALESNYDPFDALPAPVVWVTMVRTAQNMVFLNLLRQNAQDVKIFRKNLTTLVLPIHFDDLHQNSIPLTAYIPVQGLPPAPTNPTLIALSLTLARSHLLLLHQVFRSMSRHLNDREELALLLDGLNRIMLAHGDDVGIVSHAMLNYLIASTRFRRLFTSGGGYTMFMPAVIKVYCEAASQPTIRAVIEFAVNRFFALHQESFIFQTCDVMSNVIALPGVDGSYVCRNIFALLATLKNSASQTNSEVSALSALTKLEEQEAILVTIAEKVPQVFLASVHRSAQDKNQLTVDVPDEFDSKRLSLDDLVRLFLTVIAHNPTILRAQQFLRFLMFLSPHLYHASASARSVLKDGISALASILLNKGIAKPKTSESASLVDELGSNAVSQTGLNQANLPQSSVPSDLLAMRLDLLSLVVGYTKAGGTLSALASQRVLEVVKVILKDSKSSVLRVAEFLADYVRAILIRPVHPELKQVVTLLSDVAPIISSYSTTVDFSGVFDVVTSLASDTVFANQPAFSRVLVNQYCSAGLEACEVAASENLLWTLTVRGSILDLLDRSLLVIGADVMSELEKREPTYEFLSGIILPFVLRMKATVEIASNSQWADKWRRDVYAQAWLRLIAYVLNVIQRADYIRPDSRNIIPGLDRRKSTDSRSLSSTPDPKPAMALVVALQILKVITTRAEQELSTVFPSIWGQIGDVLKETLADGDAGFAIPSRGGYSEPPSPTHSPRTSSFNIGADDGNPFLTPSMAPSAHRTRAERRPRIIDYMTWSLIEWLCLRRTPLALQMRVFIQEKVALLHQELIVNGAGNQSLTASPIISAMGMPSGGLNAPLTARGRPRPVSNIFSKPRRSFLSGADPSSAVSTPRSSTLFANAVSLPSFDEFGMQSSTPRKEDGPGRQAGYQLMPSPLTPSRRAARESGPKIVHLGPVRPLSPSGGGPRRSFSPSGQRSGIESSRSAFALAREMVVESPVLVRMTVRRIRVAQAMLGYPLLPLANVSSMDSSMTDMNGELAETEGLVKAWSRAEAVEMLMQETKDLIEEWRDDEGLDGIGDDSGVLVDLEEPRSPLS
ncbi:hypothetical protein BD309DRAFT_873000 [Dichomitus squalens]|uniref:Protein UNC80 C-terminal domain-containing protein n=1 Tax=Dichomitus squalens TaxID=114155 RepID=A0A4V2K6S7_9APHY|nr:hypothetical protein BD309DRAFT_873000 [Dichomitus squalens]TBU53383.1 hypothetical protein BD310DRAFT_830251 [Dichomitus squalens]